MKQRVLIVGAKGMLGQALVRAFHNAPQPPLTVRGGEGELFSWDRDDCDITDRDAVQQKITDAHPSIIINAAAYNDVDGAEKNATLANRINGEAVGYLVSAAAKVGATLVHYSTDYVFDGTKKEGYREDDTPNPISAYGKSKLLGEQRIKNQPACRQGRESRIKNFYLVRTSRLFGKQGNGKQSFVDLMLERSLGGSTSKYIEVVDEEFSSPTYVEDLAERTREIIEQKKPSGIYHVINSGATTWYGFAQEIFRQKQELVKPVSSSRFPRPAKRPAYSQLLNTKLPPLRSWQEALRAYLLARSETS